MMNASFTTPLATASLAQEIPRLAQEVNLVAHKRNLIEVMLRIGEESMPHPLWPWYSVSRSVLSQRAALHIAAIDEEIGRHLYVVTYAASLRPACVVEVYAEIPCNRKNRDSATHHARSIQLESVPPQALIRAHAKLLALTN